MQGPSYLDLAKTLADEHLTGDYDHRSEAKVDAKTAKAVRQWLGSRLIDIGERLMPRPTELQLEVSTGPPCP